MEENRKIYKDALESAETMDNGVDRTAKLREIKERINDRWLECDKSYLVVGRDLLESKTFFGKHGEWEGWLKEASFPFSIRQAQRLMRVAEWFGKTTPGSHLDFSKAYILTRIPNQKLDDFLKNCGASGSSADSLQAVQKMTKRELEEAIRKYLGTSIPRPRKVEDSESCSPETSSEDNVLDTLCKLETTMKGLVENVINGQVKDGVYEILISNLRKLCEVTLGKLPDVELG